MTHYPFHYNPHHSFKNPSLSYKLTGVPQTWFPNPLNPSPFPCGLVNLLSLILSPRSRPAKFSYVSRSTSTIAFALGVSSSYFSRTGSSGSGESPRTDASSQMDAPVADMMDIECPIVIRLLLCPTPAPPSTVRVDASLFSVTSGKGAKLWFSQAGLGLRVAPTILGLLLLTLPKLPAYSLAILR
jgi:hypothetical protein